jgi:hypothetical protein
VADVVRKDDEITVAVEQLARAKKHPAKIGRSKLCPLPPVP